MQHKLNSILGRFLVDIYVSLEKKTAVSIFPLNLECPSTPKQSRDWVLVDVHVIDVTFMIFGNSLYSYDTLYSVVKDARPKSYLIVCGSGTIGRNLIIFTKPTCKTVIQM